MLHKPSWSMQISSHPTPGNLRRTRTKPGTSVRTRCSRRFNRGDDVGPWLFTIMRNLFINSYRRKKLEKRLFSRASPEMVTSADVSTYASAPTRIELKEKQSIIDAMPAILRISICLYSQGYKYHEIAGITQTAVGTTKSRIHTARQLLRKNSE